MTRRLLYQLLFLAAFISCNDTNKKAGSGRTGSTDTATLDASIAKSHIHKEEQQYLKRKRLLSNRLALYDLEEGTDDFELRLWLFPSMWDPSILYVLKARDTSWTLFHYQYYTLRGNDNYFDKPNLDSVVMETVRPQKLSWQTYIDNLQLDSLWSLQTESAILGKTFGVFDGHRYVLEFRKDGKYKYLFYTTPESFQEKDSNHKKFTGFINRLIDPIIYNAMRNP